MFGFGIPKKYINEHKTNNTGNNGMWLMHRLNGLIRVLLLTFVTVSVVEAAKVEIKDVEFSSLPNDLFEVHLTFDGAPPEPKGYTIEKPARIALDLLNVSSGLSKKNHKLNFANARSVTVLEAKNRTRVIISLDRLYQHKEQRFRTICHLLVGGTGGSSTVTKSAGATASTNMTTKAAALTQIEDIDFRRDEEGGGKVIIRLSDSRANPDV
mgnify:CR=1 FL=1